MPPDGLPRLFERAPIAALVTDADGLVEYINPQFTKLTGYSLEDIVGQPYLRFARPTKEQEEDAWRALASGDPWRGAGCGERRDGATFHAFVAISPITNDDDEITHYLALSMNRALDGPDGEALLTRPAALSDSVTLTDREQVVLTLVARGLKDNEIAERLEISVRTVNHHVSDIIGKLGATNRTSAVALAYNLNIQVRASDGPKELRQ